MISDQVSPNRTAQEGRRGSWAALDTCGTVAREAHVDGRVVRFEGCRSMDR